MSTERERRKRKKIERGRESLPHFSFLLFLPLTGFCSIPSDSFQFFLSIRMREKMERRGRRETQGERREN